MTTMQSWAQAIPATTGGFHGAYTRGDETARRFLPRHPSEPDDWENRIAHVEGRAPATAVWSPFFFFLPPAARRSRRWTVGKGSLA